jgi:hypothetical protein
MRGRASYQICVERRRGEAHDASTTHVSHLQRAIFMHQAASNPLRRDSFLKAHVP